MNYRVVQSLHRWVFVIIATLMVLSIISVHRCMLEEDEIERQERRRFGNQKIEISVEQIEFILQEMQRFNDIYEVENGIRQRENYHHYTD